MAIAYNYVASGDGQGNVMVKNIHNRYEQWIKSSTDQPDIEVGSSPSTYIDDSITSLALSITHSSKHVFIASKGSNKVEM